jgi:hypothetical protein
LNSHQSLYSFYFAPILIQWIIDEIEVVHPDMSSYIALADTTVDWQHGSAQYLSWKDLTSYGFLSVSIDGFVPISMQLAFGARLGDEVF